MTNNINKPQMKEGIRKPNFWNENTYLRNQNLIKILNQIYHTDTIYRNKHWRVQGYIYTKDLTLNIPQQLIEANPIPKIRNGKTVLEIWAMIIYSELPF